MRAAVGELPTRPGHEVDHGPAHEDVALFATAAM
jgi:hypothetical protein